MIAPKSKLYETTLRKPIGNESRVERTYGEQTMPIPAPSMLENNPFKNINLKKGEYR